MAGRAGLGWEWKIDEVTDRLSLSSLNFSKELNVQSVLSSWRFGGKSGL